MTHATRLEQRSIDFVPPEERHGRPASLFFVWFAANTSITAVVTGALFVVLGNSVAWAIPAILLGNAAGGFFTALHSAQGPVLGVPQMIQSRAQFGYRGAIIPLVLALTIFLGFYATGLVLGGQALADLVHISGWIATSVFAVFSTVLAVYGYTHIHRFSHLAAILSGFVFVGLFIRVITDDEFGSVIHDGSFDWAPFILGVSLAASWQLTFGPYVADYSRYLPASTPKKATIGWTFAGSMIGGSLAMVLGAMVAALGGPSFLHDQVGYLADLGGPLATLVLLGIITGKLTGDTLSAYGGYMSLVTIVTSLSQSSSVRSKQRVLYVSLISAAALAIALAATDTFLTTFTNFLLFLLYFMTPWSAINLADYYWVRREQYSIADLFKPDGIYGTFNRSSFIAYVIGVAAQVPFMNSSLYVGPIAKRLGGAEVSWILGLVVAAGLYVALSRRSRPVSRSA